MGDIDIALCKKKKKYNSISCINDSTINSFFKHFKLSKHASFPFFLHASNLLHDVIMLTDTINTVFCYKNSSHDDFFSKFAIFLQNMFTQKLICDLIFHWFSKFVNKLKIISK